MVREPAHEASEPRGRESHSKDSDKMDYGVDEAPPPSFAPPSAWPGGCGGCAVHPASPVPPAPTRFWDPSAGSQDPWTCRPCAPSAQEGQCHLDSFGKGKGKSGKGEPRPRMPCFNCLGLSHPVRVCPSPYGAGGSKTGDKCKTCGSDGHDTPTCTSQGGHVFAAP